MGKSTMRNTLCTLLIWSFVTAPLTAYGAHSKSTWQPVGKATLSVLFWDIYTAELYNDSSRFNGIVAPLKLSLTYHRAINRQRLVSETCEQFKQLGHTSVEDLRWCQALESVFPDVAPGDQLTVVLNEATGSLWFNDELQVQWRDTTMVSKFLSIWLSPKSSYPKQVEQLTNTKN